MSDLFLKIVNMSISASWLVLVVLLLRFVLKKAPKWASVLLWGIVAVRLVLPFSIESVLSLIPTAQTISPDIMMDSTPSVQTGIPAINSVINPVIGSSFTPDPGASVNPLQIWIPVLSVIWLVGVAALLVYTVVSYWRLRRKVSEAVILRDNIYQSENAGSPFVLGMIKPKIYLPYHMDEQDLSHVVAHEQAHIRRRDHWWKPLGFLLLTIHWFNPLMWLAYVLLCRDIELACDEKVIKELGNEQRADYTQALVSCSVNRRMIAACPLAFGEVGVKERVKSVMNYKKPAFWIIILAIIACVVVAVCFLTNPVGEEHPDDGYYLLIGADGVESVEISLPNSGGGIVNADGSPFKQGEKLWLEQMQGVTDLRGLKIVALSADGEVVYALSVPENATDAEIINTVGSDGWLIVPSVFEDESAPNKVSFKAEILEIHDGYYLVKPEPTWAINSADRIEVPMRNMYPSPEPQIGDIIEITYSGEILETYPARIKEVYGIRVVTENTLPLNTEADRIIGYSALYSEELINEAFSVAEREFYRRFGNCTLTELRYDEEIENRYAEIQMNWWNNNGQELITVYSTFETSEQGSGACVWYLVRTEDKKSWDYATWEHLGKNISLNDVIILSQKGYDLTWSDFEQFKYIETGSGLYIRVYEINEMYELWIGGSGPDSDPMYIYLALADDIDTRIDIRDGGVTDFIGADHSDVLLANAIHDAILEENKPSGPEGLYHCASFVMLESEEISGTPAVGSTDHRELITVYGLALHQDYSFLDNGFSRVSGSHIPVALTFEAQDGKYVLKEYWKPRDGSFYINDIRDKFPDHVEDDAIDRQKYVLVQNQDCYDQAIRYGGIDTDSVIEDLFKTIESSQMLSSKPSDYIDEYSIEYRELTYYGEYTLRYCFEKFLQGGQTGVRGHLMRKILNDLAPEAQLRLHTETGQEYFDEWKAGAIRVSEQHDMGWIEENQPAMYLLLKLMDE